MIVAIRSLLISAAFVFFPFSDSFGQIILKGISPGMDIESAHEQATARMADEALVSPLYRPSDSRAFFLIDMGSGRVVADERDRVVHIEFSDALTKKLFDLDGVTKESFAKILSEAWGIGRQSWRAGEIADREKDFKHYGGRHYIECFVEEQGVSIVIEEQNKLIVRTLDRDKVIKKITR